MFMAQKIENLNLGISALDIRLWPELTTDRLIPSDSASFIELGNYHER